MKEITISRWPGKSSRHKAPLLLLVHHLAAFLILTGSLGLGFAIRTINVQILENKYLIDPDSYRFLRQVDIISSQGGLPTIDTMRWNPVGRDLSTHLSFYSYVLAGTYRLLRTVRPRIHIYHVAAYSSVVCYLLFLLIIGLIWQHIFDLPTALLTVNLLAISPSLNLHRSIAGVTDRDAFCLLLWAALVFLYILAIEGTRIWGHLLAAASGILAGIFALSWEGCGLGIVTVACWTGFRLLRNRLSTHDVQVYSIWYTCFALIALIFTRAYRNWLIPHAFTALMVPTGILLCCLFFLSLRHDSVWTKRITFNHRFSKGVASSLIGGAFSLLILLLLIELRSARFGETLQLIFDNFLSPLGKSRLMRTVAELEPLSGILWVRQIGMLVIGGLIGSTILASRFFMNEQGNFTLSILAFEVVLCGTLISLFPRSETLANAIYCGGLLGGGTLFLISYALPVQTGARQSLPANHECLLLIFLWLFIGIFTMRGAVRYGFFLDPLLIGACAYFIMTFIRFWTKGNVDPLGEMGVIGILLAAEIYASQKYALWTQLSAGTNFVATLLGLGSGSLFLFRLSKRLIPLPQRLACLVGILFFILLVGYIQQIYWSWMDTPMPRGSGQLAKFL